MVDTNLSFVLPSATMHTLPTFGQNLAVAAVALLAASLYTVHGIRSRRCDPPHARALFVTAAIALLITVLMLVKAVSPVIAYGILCLALAGFQLASLLQDERVRARQRRAALLTPRAPADLVPTIWVVLAVATGLMLMPYIALNVQAAAAVIVALCTFLMAGVAWRIASAPQQLFGDDVQYERARDRSSRTRKAGVTAVIAMGTVMVFMVFVNYDMQTVAPLLLTLQDVSLWTWALSGASWIAYSSYLGFRQSSAS